MNRVFAKFDEVHFGRVVVLALVLTGLVGTCRAHPAGLTSATAKFQPNGHCSIRVTFDVLAAALNDRPERIADDAMRQLVTGPRPELERRLAAARNRFERQLVIRIDGHDTRPDVRRFPSAEDVAGASGTSNPERLPLLLEAEFDCRVGPGKHVVQIAFPDVVGTVVFSVEKANAEPVSEALAAGQYSSAFWVEDVGSGTAYAAVESVDEQGPQTSPATAVVSYVKLGYTHILPNGFDHLLFILGLLVFARGWRALLAQVTVFTIAHTVTLGLALYGVVRVPAAVIEPIIAFSIAVVAFDNVVAERMHVWRLGLIFVFGLVHGLGFAGALREVGIARQNFTIALFGFNLGVELGQVTVVAIGWAVLAKLRSRAEYRAWIAVPASLCIGFVAVVWTIQRLVG